MTSSLEVLFDRYRSRGDVRALAVVFDRTAPELLRIAMRFTRETGAAEDLLQDTFVAAIESVERYDAGRPLVPWLAGILSNHARRTHRAATRVPDPQRLAQRAEHATGRTTRELEAGIAEAIDRLPARYREVVVLRLQHDMEPGAIAQLLDLPPATVRTRLHRGLSKLRRSLPASLAALVPPVQAPGGIDGVRAEVMDRASRNVVTTGAASATGFLTLGGIVVTRTHLLLAGLLLVGVVCFSLLGDLREEASQEDPGTTTALRADASSAGPALAVRDDAGRSDAATNPSGAPGSSKDATKSWFLTGKVFANGGTPFPGARIDVEIRREDATTKLPPVYSDEEGRYRMDLSSLKTWSQPERHAAALVARPRHINFGLGYAKYIELHDWRWEQDLQAHLTLSPGALVMGRVLDRHGKPVAGARAALIGQSVEDPQYRPTDAEGRYLLAGNNGSRVRVESALGWRQTNAFSVGENDAIEVEDIILDAAGVIAGVVVDPADKPVAGVEVLCRKAAAEPHVKAVGAAVSGPDGRFQVLVPDKSRYLLMLASGAGRECAIGDENVRLTAGGTRLAIRVEDPQGRRLPGAKLELLGWRKKDASVLDGLLSGEVSVAEAWRRAAVNATESVLSPGGEDVRFVEPESAWLFWATVPGSMPVEGALTLKPDQSVAEITLVVPRKAPRGTLDLELLDPEGKRMTTFGVEVESVAGTELRSLRPDSLGRLPPAPAGRVRIRVAPGAGESWLEHTFLIHDYFQHIERIVEVPAGGTLPLTLRATRGGRVRLRLDYPDGKRPHSVILLSTMRRLDEPDAPKLPLRHWFHESVTGGTSVTNAHHPDIPRRGVELFDPGTYRLEVQVLGLEGPVGPVYERDVVIRAGKDSDVAIEMSPTQAPR